MNLKHFLWRVIYAVVVVVVLLFVIPLLFELVGISLPAGPALTLVKFAGACLILIYVFFGPEPPAIF